MIRRITIVVLIIFVFIGGRIPKVDADTLTTELTDNFSQSSALWSYLGSANPVEDILDSGNTVLQLTESKTSEVGTIWLNQKVSPPFDVTFRYRMLDSYGYQGGADGLVFMFNKQQNIAPVLGGGMGFEIDEDNMDNGNGYGVEFDTWQNEWDSSASHIALFHKTPSSSSSQYLLANSEFPDVESTTWKYVKIEVKENSVNTYWATIQRIGLPQF